MRSLVFAWRSLIRQPARTALGVLGIAAVGALLFDMLLLSRGLVVSFRELLDRAGFDVRVMAADALPLAGPQLRDARRLAQNIAALPEVEAAVPIRIGSAETTAAAEEVSLTLVGAGISVERGAGTPHRAVEGSTDLDAGASAQLNAHGTGHRPLTIVAGAVPPGGAERSAKRNARSSARSGAGAATHRPWAIVAGANLPGIPRQPPPLLVNRNLADRLEIAPGAMVTLRGSCRRGVSAPPPVAFRVTGIAEFPFDAASQMTAAASLDNYARVCGEENAGAADLLLVASRAGRDPGAAADAIRRVRPDLHVFTNEEILDRFQQTDFAYFRQISVVLASVTLFFGFLLIAVLLTVSVNQRFGELAALRAIGFSRRRVVADVLWESLLLVSAGGLLALPLGLALSLWLDAVLRAMPEIPAEVSFFVFELRALAAHVVLLGLTALSAALYPMWLVARLPIAATLREEVVS